ncbi:L,D-transpeptidase family protein [Sporolactobacillus shoreicorticis]|uniref:L,D-transpeptidase n=1 Tax=Sporolactobacillus shoreicorticis TaxID=1923877 RepID=A0ABW5S3P9_9BACL|nr:L,D-transpeptidase family protein [Sporolactobacillus shoreicorticis]MCO7124190.1 L,D-transpeptidase family protein [Sporolactobacillus shoreicorticis]
MKSIKKNNQLILVTTNKSRSSSVIVQTFSRDKHGKWKRIWIMNGITGKYGFTRNKHEGDKKAPAGEYTITKAFGRYKNPGTELSYHKITKYDVWVDNIHSRYYNTLQSMKKVHQYSEKMNIPQYDYGFVINYNTKRIKGKGSVVFFHIARGKYTLGCTAVSKNNVVKLLKWLNPKKKPIIIQSPQSDLYRY